MKKFLNAVPIPICGLMLGIAALGNLLQSVSVSVLNNELLGTVIHSVCGIIALIIWIIFFFKIIFFFDQIKASMHNPVLASVSGTFPMATMILSVYAEPFIGFLAEVIWFAALILQIGIIIWFTINFIPKLNLENVYASYFIAYAGIAVASFTAPAFNQNFVGLIAYWIGLIGLIFIFVPVVIRYLKIPVKEPFMPLFCIFAAPFALYMTGYMNCYTPDFFVVAVLTAFSTLFLIMVLIRLPKILKIPFYPTYAAFTFPFVICASAAFQSALYFDLSWLMILSVIETLFAGVMVIYVFVRYVIALLPSMK